MHALSYKSLQFLGHFQTFKKSGKTILEFTVPKTELFIHTVLRLFDTSIFFLIRFTLQHEYRVLPTLAYEQLYDHLRILNNSLVTGKY